jgi:hypothetical protein
MKSARVNGSDCLVCWECAGALHDQAGLKLVNTAAFVLIGLLALVVLAAVVLFAGVGGTWHF